MEDSHIYDCGMNLLCSYVREVVLEVMESFNPFAPCCLFYKQVNLSMLKWFGWIQIFISTPNKCKSLGCSLFLHFLQSVITSNCLSWHSNYNNALEYQEVLKNLFSTNLISNVKCKITLHHILQNTIKSFLTVYNFVINILLDESQN